MGRSPGQWRSATTVTETVPCDPVVTRHGHEPKQNNDVFRKASTYINPTVPTKARVEPIPGDLARHGRDRATLQPVTGRHMRARSNVGNDATKSMTAA